MEEVARETNLPVMARETPVEVEANHMQKEIDLPVMATEMEEKVVEAVEVRITERHRPRRS